MEVKENERRRVGQFGSYKNPTKQRISAPILFFLWTVRRHHPKEMVLIKYVVEACKRAAWLPLKGPHVSDEPGKVQLMGPLPNLVESKL